MTVTCKFDQLLLPLAYQRILTGYDLLMIFHTQKDVINVGSESSSLTLEESIILHLAFKPALYLNRL
jgi:hypothetical protein